MVEIILILKGLVFQWVLKSGGLKVPFQNESSIQEFNIQTVTVSYEKYILIYWGF